MLPLSLGISPEVIHNNVEKIVDKVLLSEK